MFTHKDVKEHEEYIEELKGVIQQLKEENSLSSTTSSQKEANSWMIERSLNSIKLYESKIRYIKLELDNPTPVQPPVMDERISNPSFRYSPRAFLAD